MSKPNGRQKHAIENLAAALNECFDAAVEAGEKRSKASMEAMEQRLDARLDKQDDTLRVFWNQLGGKENERLPIDD